MDVPHQLAPFHLTSILTMCARLMIAGQCAFRSQGLLAVRIVDLTLVQTHPRREVR